MKPVPILFLVVVLAQPALAQEHAPAMSKAESVLRAIRLPTIVVDIRESGVPEEEVQAILKNARTLQLPPWDAQQILEESDKAVREHGPVENLGAFVQAKLREGLRGRDLAAAIHAEHEARGMGKGKLKKADERSRGKGYYKEKKKPAGSGEGVKGSGESPGKDEDDHSGHGHSKKDKGGKPEDAGKKPEGAGGGKKGGSR